MAPRVLIVGAGSMGVIVGYHLSLAGADVSFLIRPHRKEDLDRPQILYCYDDNQLKHFRGYSHIIDPYEMVGAGYDYIFVTLDGASLRNSTGVSLVKMIGDVTRGTSTKVILGTVFIDIRYWFLHLSGLADHQVTNGFLGIHAYTVKAVILPVHPPTDASILLQADIAYYDRMGQGLILDDSSPMVANDFEQLYNACGVSRCVTQAAAQLALSSNPIFTMFAACTLAGWPRLENLSSNGNLWDLTVAAFKEIQRLGVHGELGQQAADQTTGPKLAESLVAWEKQMLPLELLEFNRFHHGEKVNAQDREHLRMCVKIGESEGKPMSALRDLINY